MLPGGPIGEAITSEGPALRGFLGKQSPAAYLSRDQLFGAPALGRDLYRRPTGLALRLYELQQRAVFDQPRRRGDGDRRRAPDARSVRVRYRRGVLLLSRRARAGAVQLLGGARHGIVQADRQDHAGTDPRLLPQHLADRRLGHLRRRHVLVRSAERTPPRRRGLDAVRRHRPEAVRPTSSGGGVSAAGGGLPLPDFTNWRAGLTFTYRVFKLGLNYTDTNLSKENCFIMTGDLGALPGGIANPGNNPFGLRSALCGATFSATLGFDINPAMLGP